MLPSWSAVVVTPGVAAALLTTDSAGDRGFVGAPAGGDDEDGEPGTLAAPEGPADTLAVDGAAAMLAAVLAGAAWRVGAGGEALDAGWFRSPVRVIVGDPPVPFDAAVSLAGPVTFPPPDSPGGVPEPATAGTPTGAP